MIGFLVTLILAAPLAASAAEYRIGVGKDETTGKLGIGFDPSSIRPTTGDHIVFEFRAGVHSAVQTTFENPCVPMAGGFDSGIFTVADGTLVDAPGLPTKNFDIITNDPLWFYDGASGECHLGAVFSVNPPLVGDQTAGAFLEAAKKTTPQAASTAPLSTSAASVTETSTITSSVVPTATPSTNSARSIIGGSFIWVPALLFSLATTL